MERIGTPEQPEQQLRSLLQRIETRIADLNERHQADAGGTLWQRIHARSSDSARLYGKKDLLSDEMERADLVALLPEIEGDVVALEEEIEAQSSDERYYPPHQKLADLRNAMLMVMRRLEPE